ncbi:MAG: hypothetical protein K9L31_00110 [Candidatus Pacebacteria bacterium]|nr:hypothetical protein [Candidatus Paceibacterota bacterium]
MMVQYIVGGGNIYGQLGDTTTSQSYVPVQVHGVGNVGFLADIEQISVGSSHVCALKNDGTAYCWGYNWNGQLGDNTTTQRNTPVQVHGVGDVGYLTDVAQISSGTSQTCATKNDGTVYCWGWNNYGELGDNTTSQRNTPVQVHGVGDVGYLTDVTQVITDNGFTCALKNDGTAYCWGLNGSGRLGDNTSTQRNTPVQVHGVGNVGYLTDVLQISTGNDYVCAVKNDGTVYCWGANSNGQLGDNTTTQRNTPVQVHGAGNVGLLTSVVQISTGLSHTCVLINDSSVYCWGYNGYGQLGDNTTSQRNTPIQVVGISVLDNFSNVLRMATGLTTNHNCLIRTDNTLYCWGLNNNGELGDNTTVKKYTPTQVHGVSNVGYLTGITQVSIGSFYVCALKNDGTVYCWGNNIYGQLGDNTTSQRNTPVQVHGVGNVGYLTDVVQISSGSSKTCATKNDGTVYCWGYNASGQLGDNTTTQRNTPVQVHGVGDVGYLTDVAKVSSGQSHTCAVKTDNTLYCWGYNSNGQLGDNTATTRNTPVQVHGVGNVGFLTDVSQISTGGFHTCAVKTDGTAYCWGYNGNGHLGDNTSTQRNTPVQVKGVGNVGFLTDISQISAGQEHTCSFKTDGTAYCWGLNGYGRLGDNTTTQRNTPVQVHGVGDSGFLTDVMDISSSYWGSCAVSTNNIGYCWGYNGNGNLGDGTNINSNTPVSINEYLVPVGFIHLVTYPSSGTFLSSTINLSGDSAFSTLTFSTTLNSQTITIKARSSATSDFSSAPAWEGCSTITSGNALSTGGCVTDGHQYIQYQATLSTNDTAVTPTLDSVVINYNQYNSEGNLISSPYDTSSDANLISRISWTASATSSNEIVKFQVRSSGDGITWSNWCGPSNTCDGNDYFLYSNNGVTLDVNHPLRDGVNDRYLQYKTVLSSGGAATPIVSEVNVQYVVNAPPEFDATYGTNGVTAIQITDDQDSDYGKVSISYRIRDPDGSTGTITPGYVTPSFEYNIGGGWVAIDQSALSAGDTSNKAVDDNNYATYTAVWSATTSIAGVFSSTTQLRVTVNDNEAANNNGTGVSATFVLDTKSPTYTTIILDSSENNIIMSSADDSQFQYRLCNDNTFPSSDTEGNSCVWSALSGNFSSSSIPWLPGKDVDGNETVYIEIKDIAGNYIYHSIVAPALPSNFDFKDISNTLINSYREFLSWGVFQATTSSSFSSYKLYHSTDGVNYSVLTDITNPSINYYHHIISTGTSSTHFYKLAVEDTDGDISDYTTIMSDVPNGQGSSDTTPPTIEPASILLPGANLKNTSVQVTFTTDELAKGEVEYRPNGSSTWVSVPSVSYVLSHSIYIQNLSPNTTYNLRLRAEDVSGNVSSYISGPDFSTVGGPIITGVNAINLTDNSVTIFWNTSTSSDSYVYYSINQNIIPSISEWSATNVACATSICQHKIDISGLTPGTRYYYYVKSTDGEGNETIDTNGGSYYTFSTTLDVNPPEISNISTPVISSNAGVIIWQTDEPSTSQVEWGTSPGVLTRTTVLDSTKSN